MNDWIDTGASPALVAPSGSAFHFSRLFPRYVDETQSRMRGLKVAWYAVDNEGAITAGPVPEPRRMHRAYQPHPRTIAWPGFVAATRFDPSAARRLNERSGEAQAASLAAVFPRG
jgi:hypothetical protein